jgi:hypothetical protein
MPKQSSKRGTQSRSTAGGIVGAMTQDLELTVEQAEEATKKAAHKAAIALGIASGGAPVVPSSKKRSAPAKQITPLRSSTRKRKD